MTSSDVPIQPWIRWSSQYSIHSLVAVGDDRLVLRGSNLIRGVSLSFLAIALAIFFGLAQFDPFDEEKDRQPRIPVGGLFLILAGGVWLAPPRVVFDRRRGLVIYRHWLRRSCYALRDIVGVQIVDGGRHRVGKGKSYQSRQLNLILDNPQVGGICLTNHSANVVTHSTAERIAGFLDVPLQDEFAHERRADAATNSDELAASPKSRLEKGLYWCGQACFVAAMAAGFFWVILSLQQPKLDEFVAEARPVRARLVSSEVKEWIEGGGSWYLSGTFEIETESYRGLAEGNLIPDKFYEDNNVRQKGRDIDVPRAKAEEFLPLWKIGQTYDGYIYPDLPNGIFFELPPAEANALMTRRLAAAAAIFLMLGIVAVMSVSHLKQRRQ